MQIMRNLSHLCDGCVDYIPDEFKIWNEGTGEYEQDPNGIDVSHYHKMGTRHDRGHSDFGNGVLNIKNRYLA